MHWCGPQSKRKKTALILNSHRSEGRYQQLSPGGVITPEERQQVGQDSHNTAVHTIGTHFACMPIIILQFTSKKISKTAPTDVHLQLYRIAM